MTRYLLGDPRRAARRQQIALMRLERQFRPTVQREIARASNAMIAGFRVSGHVRPDDRHPAEMERIFRQMYAASVEALGGEIITQGKSRGRIPERKDFAQHFARMAATYFAAWGAQRVAGASETTRTIIQRGVASGYRQGLSVPGVADLIASVVPQTYSARAETIARTETHGAASFGAHEAAVETGLRLQKRWVAAADDRTRQDHADADGQTVGMDEPFIVGGFECQYPGDPSLPVEHVVNCRCVEAHVVLD